MSAYESIRQGLIEALAFARGEETEAIVHQVEVLAEDVSATRASTGQQQGTHSQCTVFSSSPTAVSLTD